MNDRLYLLVIALGLLTAIACGGSDDDTGEVAGSGPASGFNGGEAGGMAGTAGSIAGSAGSVDAVTGGIGGSIEAGTGGLEAGIGGIGAGTGGIRAGTGGIEAGTGGLETGTGGIEAGTGGSDAGTGGTTDTLERRCLTSGSQIVLIGDSYINWITHTFISDMSEVVGVPVRNYAVGGFSMASGGLGLIPPQFDQAIVDDPDILVVVMTGGGNDILIADEIRFPGGGNCSNDPNSGSTPVCQDIVNLAVDTAVENMDKLVVAGIPDVIYFFYPEVPPTWLGSDPNGILGYARPLARAACEDAFTRTGGELTCHFVDLQPVFEGHPEYFADADLHPNSTGSAAMAQAIWEAMVDNCIAQPESSGCCIP